MSRLQQPKRGLYRCPTCHEMASRKILKGKPARCTSCMDIAFEAKKARSAEWRATVERNKLAAIELRSRVEAERALKRELKQAEQERISQEREARKQLLAEQKLAAEKSARRRAIQARWRKRHPRRKPVKVVRIRSIGQPNSPYEIAVRMVENETGEKRSRWELIIHHPNNRRVNELAVGIVEELRAFKRSERRTEIKAAA